MVTGEDAKTTSIIRNRFVKTELSGKIGNRIFDRAAGSGFPIGIVASEVFLEFLKNLLQFAKKIFVLPKFFQPGLPRKLHHSNGFVIGAVQEVGTEIPEQTPADWLRSPRKI